MEVTRKDEFNIIKKEEFEKTSFSSYQHRSSIYRRDKHNVEHTLYRNKEYKRGDIVYVSDRVFSEDRKNSILQKSRPAIVIQNDRGNYHSKYLIVCYISTRLKNSYLPTHVYIDDIGRVKNSTVMAENIQSVHKDYCKIIGEVKPELMEKIDMAIAESVGLKQYINKIKQLEEENLRLQEAVAKLESKLDHPNEKEHKDNLLVNTGILRVKALGGKNHTFDISSGRILLSSLDSSNLVELGNKDDVKQLIRELQEVINYI